MKIHHSAQIGKDVILGENNIIAENVVIRGNVTIGNDNYIGANSLIINNVEIGNSNIFHGFISLGTLAEMGAKGDYFLESGLVYIGNNNTFREFVTVNSPALTKETFIGNNNYFMARSHLAHDVKVCNNIIMATNSCIAGSVILEDYAFAGLGAIVHQGLIIGESAMLGMNSTTVKNVPPFSTVVGVPSKIVNINKVGLERRGFTLAQINELEMNYNICKHNYYTGESVLIKKLQRFINATSNCLEFK